VRRRTCIDKMRERTHGLVDDRIGRPGAQRELALLSEGAVLAQRLARPLAAGSDDEEQPARHGSALAAAGRRASSSLANVALLRLHHRDSDAARASSDREHVVPMHRMQRLRPSGTSAGRPFRAFAAMVDRRSPFLHCGTEMRGEGGVRRHAVAGECPYRLRAPVGSSPTWRSTPRAVGTEDGVGAMTGV
jgi:hypothetical protein